MSSSGCSSVAHSHSQTAPLPLSLPEELLLHIFDLATYGPAREINALVELRPFEKDYSDDVDALCDEPLNTKRALALTCKLFRRLVLKFLFEDIRIRYGSESLAEAMEREQEVGTFVKRVSVSLQGFKASDHWIASYPKGTRRILQRCSNVLILTRPQSLPVEAADLEDGNFPATDNGLDDLRLPNLQRVDWFNSPIDTLPSTLPTPKFIWKSNSLQTLTIGPDHFPLQLNTPPIVDLLKLHTIRLRSMHTPGNVGEGVIDPESVRLPALRRLVFSLPDGIYTLFFEQFLRACGPGIKEIEIAPDARFLRHDFISVLLLNCSNATVLNFPVFTTKPTRKNTRRQAVGIIYLITQVGLSSVGFRNDFEDEDDADSQWALLAGHLLALFGARSRFSKLERLALYGKEWEWILSDPRSKGAVELIKSKNVEIVCEHESVATTLKSVCETLDLPE
ncbi:hypothetical protein ACEPAG_3170 [Sanghuangporus baumii]